MQRASSTMSYRGPAEPPMPMRICSSNSSCVSVGSKMRLVLLLPPALSTASCRDAPAERAAAALLPPALSTASCRDAPAERACRPRGGGLGGFAVSGGLSVRGGAAPLLRCSSTDMGAAPLLRCSSTDMGAAGAVDASEPAWRSSAETRGTGGLVVSEQLCCSSADTAASDSMRLWPAGDAAPLRRLPPLCAPAAAGDAAPLRRFRSSAAVQLNRRSAAAVAHGTGAPAARGAGTGPCSACAAAPPHGAAGSLAEALEASSRRGSEAPAPTGLAGASAAAAGACGKATITFIVAESLASSVAVLWAVVRRPLCCGGGDVDGACGPAWRLWCAPCREPLCSAKICAPPADQGTE